MLLAASGWWFGSILLIIIWIAIAFWPARVAARKGHSFFLYFLFSLIFLPRRADRRIHGPRSNKAGDRLTSPAFRSDWENVGRYPRTHVIAMCRGNADR